MRRAIHCAVYVALLLRLGAGGGQPFQDNATADATANSQSQQASAAPQPAVDPEKTGPIKHYIMIEMLNGVDLLLLDRWYITYHAPETLRRTERRQTKYATFRTYALSPDEVKAMNAWQIG